MKKVQLERILQSLEAVPTPRPDIEQYPTPAALAAEVAYIAHGRGDLAGRRVLDAGCGSGILAIAAKLLGAAEVVGVDLDPEAVEVAARNGRRANADVEWRHADICAVKDPFDTVLMNPPFGSQRKHADLPFLDRAMALAPVVYSFHNRVTEGFLARRIETRGARITDRIPYDFPVPRMFRFHTRALRRVGVVLFRIDTRPPPRR